MFKHSKKVTKRAIGPVFKAFTSLSNCKTASGILTLVAILFSANPGFTLVLDQPKFSELIQNSSLIVMARVEVVDPQVGIESPETLTVIRVLEDFGTNAPEELKYTLPEGQKYPDFNRIGGAPKLLEGKTYLLFLSRKEWSMTPYSYWHFGVFVLDDELPTNIEGQCIRDVGDYVNYGNFIRYPELIPGPIVDNERKYWKPTPNEDDREYLGDASDCLSTNDLLSAVEQGVGKYFDSDTKFYDRSFRVGSEVSILEVTDFTPYQDDGPQCVLLDEYVCDNPQEDGDSE